MRNKTKRVIDSMPSRNPIIYGTTIYVGKMEVELEYGKFTSYTYQTV